MRIENSQTIRNGFVNREPDDTNAPSTKPAEEQVKSANADSLDLSATARASVLSQEESAETAAPAQELSADRLAEIRDRIKSGSYNSNAVLAKTADRLLAFYSA